MYRYFDPKDDDSYLRKDQTYSRIMSVLDGLVTSLPPDDKKLFIKMVSESYHKHYPSIQSKSQGDTELIHSLIMALLVEQTKEIKRLNDSRRKKT